jgi:hypothetical protein
VEEQYIALSHLTGPKYFQFDWQLWQKSSEDRIFGNTPHFEFHRYATDFGFAKSDGGVAYEKMTEVRGIGIWI